MVAQHRKMARLSAVFCVIVSTSLLSTTSCQSFHRRSDRGLRLELYAIPSSPNLEEDRRFLAEAVLVNYGRAPFLIEWQGYPKSEAELFTPEGGLLHRWSDDVESGAQASVLLLNPGERAFFEMVMPTRGMRPGEPHKLVARLLGSPAMEATKTITPKKAP